MLDYEGCFQDDDYGEVRSVLGILIGVALSVPLWLMLLLLIDTISSRQAAVCLLWVLLAGLSAWLVGRLTPNEAVTMHDVITE